MLRVRLKIAVWNINEEEQCLRQFKISGHFKDSHKDNEEKVLKCLKERLYFQLGNKIFNQSSYQKYSANMGVVSMGAVKKSVKLSCQLTYQTSNWELKSVAFCLEFMQLNRDEDKLSKAERIKANIVNLVKSRNKIIVNLHYVNEAIFSNSRYQSWHSKRSHF